MNRSSSLRLTLCPMPRISSVAWAITVSLGARGNGGVACGGGGRLDRLDDVHVAGTPADVARDRPPYVLVGRVVVLLDQGGADEHHPGGAVAALQAVFLFERRLDRAEGAVR